MSSSSSSSRSGLKGDVRQPATPLAKIGESVTKLRAKKCHAELHEAIRVEVMSSRNLFNLRTLLHQFVLAQPELLLRKSNALLRYLLKA
jgi:hypothetical protein